jgi:hypothetical protein
MKNTKPTGEVNGIFLGVHKVIDAKSTDDYLAKRFTHWNITGPPGYQPHLHDLLRFTPISVKIAIPPARVAAPIGGISRRFREFLF